MTTLSKLCQTESTATLLSYRTILVRRLSGLALMWSCHTSHLKGLLFLLAMGIAAVLGVVWLRELPSRHTLLGGAITLASSVSIFHRQRFNKPTT